MTQSKDTDPFNLGSLLDDDDTITINLNETAGTTTTYWSDSASDVVYNDGTFTITSGATDTINIGNWELSNDFGIVDNINPTTVEQMCKQYPGLEKVWRNFKSVYDMCKQDYEGKKKAGELDDDIPF